MTKSKSKSIKPPCRHCQKNPAGRPKGLCWPCYYSPARDLYATTSKFANRGYGHHAGLGLRPLPATATAAPPGSEEKVLVLIERCKNGEALHHPDDVFLPPPTPRGQVREVRVALSSRIRRELED